MSHPTEKGQIFTTITDNTCDYMVSHFLFSRAVPKKRKGPLYKIGKKICTKFMYIMTTCGRMMPLSNCTKSKNQRI